MSLIPWKNKQGSGRRHELAPRPARDEFRTEMDRLFERFFQDPWGAPLAGSALRGEWDPTVDVTENEKEISIRAEVPGVEPKDIKVTLAANVLTLEGEKRQSSERKEKDYYQSECSYGSFLRRIPLAAPVDESKVSAEHSHGVLTIRLPKTRTAAARHIAVKEIKKP
jgi:HSP20 family protein